MKRFLQTIAIVLCLGTAPVLMTTGCNTTQKRIVFNSLYSTGLGVNNAYAAYNDLLVTGQVDTHAYAEISKDYADFQLVFSAAIAVAQFNTNAATPPDVAAKAAALIAKIGQEKAKAKPATVKKRKVTL